MKSGSISSLLNLLKILVSLVFLGYMASLIDFQSILQVVKRSSPIILLLAGLLFVSVVIFDAVRLILFFRTPQNTQEQGRLSFKSVVRISKVNLASLAVANIGFGTVGSELFKVAAFRKNFGSYAATTGAIVGVRAVAACMTLTLFLIALGLAILQGHFNLDDWLPTFGASQTQWGLLIAGIIIGVGCLVIFWRSAKIRSVLASAVEPFRGKSNRQYAELLLVSFSIEMVRLTSLTLFVTAFGVSLPILSLLLISTVSTILILLPISWNGLGLREASVAGLLTAFGVEWEVASAIAIVSRVVMIFVSMTGVAYLTKATTGESL